MKYLTKLMIVSVAMMIVFSGNVFAAEQTPDFETVTSVDPCVKSGTQDGTNQNDASGTATQGSGFTGCVDTGAGGTACTPN